MTDQLTTPTTVELWIRSFAPTSAGQTQERALECLDDLESTVGIESVEVGIWGKQVEVDYPDRTMRIPQLRRIETRLEAFESWAARTGRRLEPFFRNTHVESMLADESYDVWRLPTVALAEFDENDDLLHVAPCRDGSRTVDVFDRLETLLGDANVPLTRNTDRRTDGRDTDGRSGRGANRGTNHVGSSASRSD